MRADQSVGQGGGDLAAKKRMADAETVDAMALKDFSRKGAIGLQGLHGKDQAPVWYRNIKIKEIK